MLQIYLNCLRTGNDYKACFFTGISMLNSRVNNVNFIPTKQIQGSMRLVKTAICRKSGLSFRKWKSTRKYYYFLKSCNSEIKQLSAELINI